MDEEALELAKAEDRFRQRTGRCPTWKEKLEIIKSCGWYKPRKTK